MSIQKETRLPLLYKYRKFIQCDEKWLRQGFVLREFHKVRTERLGTARLPSCSAGIRKIQGMLP